MKKTYRVLAYLLAAEVVVQAAAIAYALFGLGKYIDDGAVVDKATEDSGQTFDGVAGFIVHGVNGQVVIPLLALIFLIVSFFAGIPGGTRRAAIVFGLIVAQVVLAVLGNSVPALGALHGLNALGIFSMALIAARKADATPEVVEAAAAEPYRTPV